MPEGHKFEDMALKRASSVSSLAWKTIPPLLAEDPSGCAHADMTNFPIDLVHEDRDEATMQDLSIHLEHLDELPSVMLISCALQRCRQHKHPAGAEQLFAHLCSCGLDAVFENPLVLALVESRSMICAKQVFLRLVNRSEYVWTSYIQGCMECGEYHFALQLFQKMQESCAHLNKSIMQTMIKYCARMKNMELGCELHFIISKEGFENDLYIGTALVDMYVKFGALSEAQDLFDNLSVQTIVSWNALLAGYAERGLGDVVVTYLSQMHLRGMSLNSVTVISCLRACASVESVHKGRHIHSEAVKRGFDIELFVANSLVDMYAKCGSFIDAQKVFDGTRARDIISWNSLISGFVEHGRAEEALMCLEKMEVQGMCLDAVTLVCILKACANTGTIGRGREVHAEIYKKGYASYPSVCNTLVGMYAKCGSYSEALHVFHSLAVRDTVSWNALIAGFAEYGLGEEALNCLDNMWSDGLSPDVVTHVCSLKGCSCLHRGLEIHAEIVKEGFESDSFTGNSLVDMYAKCGSLEEAQYLFGKLPVQNTVAWNALIGGYADHGCGSEALKCMEEMQLNGLSPNDLTLVSSLKACGCLEDVEKGHKLHTSVIKGGSEGNCFVGTALVDMYARCGSVLEAEKVFDEVQPENLVSWNVLITMFVEHGLALEALSHLDRMQTKMVSPDVVTLLTGLKACGAAGALRKGQELHVEIVRKNYGRYPFVENAMVEMYLKCGSLVEAQEVFDKSSVRDVVTWTAMIMGYASQGESAYAFRLLDRMQEEGVNPNELTLLSILTACSHAGLVDEGLKFFDAIEEGYCTIRTIEHHNCLIDLLSRAGQLDQAALNLEEMPFRPDLVSWSTVLGACRK